MILFFRFHIGKSMILCSRLQMLTIALSKSLHKLFKLKKFVTVPISLIAAFLPAASPRPDKGWKMILFADGGWWWRVFYINWSWDPRREGTLSTSKNGLNCYKLYKLSSSSPPHRHRFAHVMDFFQFSIKYQIWGPI